MSKNPAEMVDEIVKIEIERLRCKTNAVDIKSGSETK